MFFVMHQEGEVLFSYPPERRDFTLDDLPEPIVKTLNEALTCHANHCYIAAAILIRKALEQLCDDRHAAGPNLKARIKALVKSVVLPVPLLDGLDHLRILGNDATHVHAEVYTNISKAEVDAAFNVTAEILRGIYQLQRIVAELIGLPVVDEAEDVPQVGGEAR